ncbi:MAG: aminopeptidase P family protein [Planctomycetota bacterium]
MDSAAYRARRDALRAVAGDGLILIPGAQNAPRNYRDNIYPFRQSSHFLYFGRVNLDGLALVIGPEPVDDVVFGPPADIDDVVWHGPHPTLEEVAAEAGIESVRNIKELPSFLQEARDNRREIRYVAPYQPGVLIWLAEVLGEPFETVRRGASLELAAAISELRIKKSTAEIAEIENALEVSARMHRAAMRAAKPGVSEASIAAEIQEIALAENRAQAYNPILSVRGEVLHNHDHGNTLELGQLLLNDSGAESPLGYASDITRTTPVGGRYDERQRAVYSAVLASQQAAIEAVKPGVQFRDLHLLAAKVMTEGLIEMGLMKGSAEDAVAAGAHALFFPHGLGHMLGLDVHDMEDLGDLVGYAQGDARSEQFGLNFLRMARKLEEDHVFTIEPGIYFIPALMDRWQGEGKNAEFVNFDALKDWRDFGGVRIEDDILCTVDGGRVLGPGIEKTIDEVEALIAN